MTLIKIELLSGDKTKLPPDWVIAKIAQNIDPEEAQTAWKEVTVETSRGKRTGMAMDKVKLFELCVKCNLSVVLEDDRLYYTSSEQDAVIDYLKYDSLFP